MHRILVVLMAVAVLCRAQDCDSSFGKFLNALKGELAPDAATEGNMEKELRDDRYRLIRHCFGQSTDDPSHCALSDDELKTSIYGDEGPLAGCAQCQNIIKGFRDRYMKSRPEVRKCFRQHLGRAIKEELEPCIQSKISNGYSFHVPPIPDFEEYTFENIGTAEQGMSMCIWCKSRLDVCKKANPGKYSSTKSCVDRGFPNIYSKHCQAARNAVSKASITGSCSGRFREVKGATCQCMESKRKEWEDKFDKIQRIVNDATEAEQCGTDISNTLGVWLTKLQDAMNQCMQNNNEDASKRNLRTLFKLACGQVVDGKVDRKKLEIGFRFARLFLECLNDRITIFCDKNCNF